MGRIGVLKTYKLFIGGKFPRTESGRYLPLRRGETLVANFSHASRKDLRDAVVAARKAQPAWAAATAFLRSQILYRAAEMLERRSSELATDLIAAGASPTAAAREVASSADRLVYYAGWADKLSSVFGSVNPVSSPHFNFTLPEPTGVVGLICPDTPPLLGLVSMLAAALVSGNTAVALASETSPLVAITLAEALATSDLPPGTANILTGKRAELSPHLASHMDINALVSAHPSADEAAASAGNLKRYIPCELPAAAWAKPDAASPYHILHTTEYKTAWHPVGM